MTLLGVIKRSKNVEINNIHYRGDYMQKENLDLTKEKYANQSRNETMLKGMHILNGVLVIAYLI